MRDPAELRMRDGSGNPIRTPPPSDEIITEFEYVFGVKLPTDYVSFLKAVNGGEPVLSDVGDTGEGVDSFYHLRDDKVDPLHDLFHTSIVFSDYLAPGIIPFGRDAFNNQFVFNLRHDPAPVGLFLFDGDKSIEYLAPSFGEFLDMLVPVPPEE